MRVIFLLDRFNQLILQVLFNMGGSGSRLANAGRKVRTPQDRLPMFGAWDSTDLVGMESATEKIPPIYALRASADRSLI